MSPTDGSIVPSVWRVRSIERQVCKNMKPKMILMTAALILAPTLTFAGTRPLPHSPADSHGLTAPKWLKTTGHAVAHRAAKVEHAAWHGFKKIV